LLYRGRGLRKGLGHGPKTKQAPRIKKGEVLRGRRANARTVGNLGALKGGDFDEKIKKKGEKGGGPRSQKFKKLTFT